MSLKVNSLSQMMRRESDGCREPAGWCSGPRGVPGRKNRNPLNPAETSTERDMKPRWRAAGLAFGKKSEKFSFDRTASKHALFGSADRGVKRCARHCVVGEGIVAHRSRSRGRVSDERVGAGGAAFRFYG
jgi:hypothetical protein